MTDEMKDIVSWSIYNTIAQAITRGERIIVMIENHNDWSYELPENLRAQERFILDISDDTLDDSYVDDGQIVITAEFDGDVYFKDLQPCDIAGIMMEDMKSAMFVKPFREAPEINIKPSSRTSEPSEKDLEISMQAFRKNNPKMFE